MKPEKQFVTKFKERFKDGKRNISFHPFPYFIH